ncbi:c-type cytochrome [Paraburkholderia acidisoli]|uniref:C-type cytochrome n=1 Tax=Paraburkholderia acidisoli TaxID=2571748 RepID=A0A7Z2GFJ4_9BURK|nr:c-type cytochrome [Paraburkholderia acidisoli]QGZ60858.1 c-type cytochrome [Paraburkholderia acidisoli]
MKRKSQANNKTATLTVARLVLATIGAAALSTAQAQNPQNAPGAANAASSGLALAQQQNCMSCHSVTRTFMGPAFHDVAAKYAGKPEAQSYLTRKILEGSTGVWGMVPMPANTQLNPAQAALLASWVLSLK